MSRSIISLGEFRTNGGGCWIELPRHSVPVSVRKDSLQISNSVPSQGCSFTQFLHPGMLSHSFVSARPPFSSAKPVLGGVSEHGIQLPKIYLSILIFLPAYAVCIFAYPRSFYLASGAGFLLQEELRIRGCLSDAFACARRGREKGMRLLSLTKHWDCLLVRSQAPAVSKAVFNESNLYLHQLSVH